MARGEDGRKNKLESEEISMGTHSKERMKRLLSLVLSLVLALGTLGTPAALAADADSQEPTSGGSNAQTEMQLPTPTGKPQALVESGDYSIGPSDVPVAGGIPDDAVNKVEDLWHVSSSGQLDVAKAILAYGGGDLYVSNVNPSGTGAGGSSTNPFSASEIWVYGAKEGVQNSFELTLPRAEIKVHWRAKLTGSSSTSLLSLNDASDPQIGGGFLVEEGGEITNTDGPAIGVPDGQNINLIEVNGGSVTGSTAIWIGDETNVFSINVKDGSLISTNGSYAMSLPGGFDGAKVCFVRISGGEIYGVIGVPVNYFTTISGGTIIHFSDTTAMGVNVLPGSELTVTGGTIHAVSSGGPAYGIYTGSLNLPNQSAGTMTGGKATIKGGTIVTSGTALYGCGKFKLENVDALIAPRTSQTSHSGTNIVLPHGTIHLGYSGQTKAEIEEEVLSKTEGVTAKWVERDGVMGIEYTKDGSASFVAMPYVTKYTGEPGPDKPDNPNPPATEKTDLSGAAITLEKDSWVYTGGEIRPAVTAVTLNGAAVPATGYTVSYSNNIEAGTATVTVTGTGDYTGAASKHFTITKAAEPGKQYAIRYNLNRGDWRYNASYPTAYQVSASSQTLSIDYPVRDGCRFLGWTYGGMRVPSYTVTLPAGFTGDLVLTANWDDYGSYRVHVRGSSHGYVSASTDYADGGETVTLTVDPNRGYELGSLSVYTDSQGREISLSSLSNGKYRFTMPYDSVTVDASFTAIRESSPKPETKPAPSTPAPAPTQTPSPSPSPVPAPTPAPSTPGGAVKVYSDVKETDWCYAGVQYVSQRGLMQGVSATDFSPNSKTTRAMVWTMLARLSGQNTEGGANWYEKGQTWAMSNGITDGADPNGTITREQIATMLWRSKGSPASGGDLAQFTDSSQISAYAQDAIRWAAEQNIVNGKGNGILDPQGPATRAEVAQMFMNFMIRMGV
jgi:uncharacterized repeat protein (TIGR02543 family)